MNGSSSYLACSSGKIWSYFSYHLISDCISSRIYTSSDQNKTKKLGLTTLSGENFTCSQFSPNTCSLLFPYLGDMKPGYRAEDFGEELQLCGWGRLPWASSTMVCLGLQALEEDLGGGQVWLWEFKVLYWVSFLRASRPVLRSQSLMFFFCWGKSQWL